MKLVVNCKTNEVIERELNAKEIAQQKLDEVEAEKYKDLMALKAQAKAAAEGKLAALGLTTDDLRALNL